VRNQDFGGFRVRTLILCFLGYVTGFRGSVHIADYYHTDECVLTYLQHHRHHLNLSLLSNIPYQGGAIIGVFMI
jgi:hypothetical protein